VGRGHGRPGEEKLHRSRPFRNYLNQPTPSARSRDRQRTNPAARGTSARRRARSPPSRAARRSAVEPGRCSGLSGRRRREFTRLPSRRHRHSHRICPGATSDLIACGQAPPVRSRGCSRRTHTTAASCPACSRTTPSRVVVARPIRAPTAARVASWRRPSPAPSDFGAGGAPARDAASRR
jgi:hypothetical protein